MGFDQLWDGFEKVCQKTENGEKFTRDILKYLQKRHEVEVKYAKSVIHLNECFKSEFEIGTMQESWLCLRDESENIGKERQAFADRLQSLIDSINNQLKDDRRDRALLVARGKKLVSDLAATEDLMKKARAKYVEARKKQDKSQESVQKSKAAGSGNVQKLQKASEKDERKADKADNEYRITVKNLKLAQDKFHDTDMPALLRDFESFEEKRMKRNQEYFQTFITHQTPLGPTTTAITERFSAKVKQINIKSDLELYVNQNRPESEPPARVTYVSYDGSVVQDVNSTTATPVSPNGSSTPVESKKKKVSKLPQLPTSKKKTKKIKSEGDKVPAVTSSASIETTPPQNKNVTIKAEIEVPKPTATVNLATPAAGESKQNTAKHQGAGDSSSEEKKPENNHKKDEKKKMSEPLELRTLYAYEATEDNELTFAENETITLLEMDDSGWWRGRNAKGEEGLFPSNFVDYPPGSEEGGGGGGGTVEINADYQAMYDYDAEDETELTIREGEILHVKTETDGWYYGCNNQGKCGNFPSNFMEPVSAVK